MQTVFQQLCHLFCSKQWWDVHLSVCSKFVATMLVGVSPKPPFRGVFVLERALSKHLLDVLKRVSDGTPDVDYPNLQPVSRVTLCSNQLIQ